MDSRRILTSTPQNQSETAALLNFTEESFSSNINTKPSYSSILNRSNNPPRQRYYGNTANGHNRHNDYQSESEEQVNGATADSRQDPNHNNNNKQGYSSTTSNYTPSRKNAILLENTANVSQDQCLRAVADLIGGSNIHYCSRLSGGRICLYLTNETLVDKMCQESGVVINEEFIPCRRYVTEAQKFVVSNCPPELSDDGLREILAPYGRIVSAPTRLRVTTNYEDLRHIKTWRRTIYVMVPENAPEMPPRMQITSVEGHKQTLYIEKDDLFCTFCKTPGHPVNRCKKMQLQEKQFPEYQPPVSQRLFVKQNRREPPKSSNSTPSLMPQFKLRGENETNKPESEPSTSQKTNETEPTAEKEIFSSESSPSLWGDILLEESNDKQNKEKDEHLPSSHNNNPSKLISKPLEETNLNPIELSDGNLTNCSIASENLSNQTSNEIFEKLLSKRKRKANKRYTSPEFQVQINTKQMKTSEQIAQDEESLLEKNENSDADSSFSNEQNDQTKNVKKKTKAKEEELLKQLVTKLKFDDSKLTEKAFLQFMQEARGKANSKIVADRVGADATELIIKLNEAHLRCTNFNLQRRIKRATEALIPNNDA